MAIPFGKIEKLYIQAYKDAALEQPAGERFEALINPETYTHKYRIDFCESQAPGTSGVALKFNKIPPQEISFDFLFDGTGVFKGASVLDVAIVNPLSGTDVAEQVESFKQKVFEYNGEKHRPNHLKIIWGTLIFKGVLVAMDIEYKLFRSDGTPLRVLARCTFKGTITETLRVARENAQSADITQARTVATGDKLSLMAYRVYNNQQFYTDVAAFNRVDSFRRLTPGTRIFFPPLTRSDA